MMVVAYDDSGDNNDVGNTFGWVLLQRGVGVR